MKRGEERTGGLLEGLSATSSHARRRTRNWARIWFCVRPLWRFLVQTPAPLDYHYEDPTVIRTTSCFSQFTVPFNFEDTISRDVMSCHVTSDGQFGSRRTMLPLTALQLVSMLPGPRNLPPTGLHAPALPPLLALPGSEGSSGLTGRDEGGRGADGRPPLLLTG